MTSEPAKGGRPPKYFLPSVPARKIGDTSPPEPTEPPYTLEQLARRQQRTYKTCLFNDHEGNVCISCYRGLGIPALGWSYQVYVVTGMTAQHPDALNFCEKMYKILIEEVQKGVRCEQAQMRLDFVFARAGADAVDCLKHYRARKAKANNTPDYPIVPTYKGSNYGYDSIIIMLDDHDYATGGIVWIESNDTSPELVTTDRYGYERRGQHVFRLEGNEQSVIVQLGERLGERWFLASMREEFELAYDSEQEKREEIEDELILLTEMERASMTI